MSRSRPSPKLANLNSALEPLYKKVAGEIRKVDAHHILFLGGTQWDGNFSVFDKPFDANVVYTFHKYWTAPDESVLRQYIDSRERYDVPIWPGESGENPDEWIAQFVKAPEKNNIGWAFWPYKKMGETVGGRQYYSTRQLGKDRGVRKAAARHWAR
jgi:endoglucanase